MADACLDGKNCAARGNGRGEGEATGHRNWFGLSVADGFVHERGDGAWGGPASGYVRASINDMAAYLRMYLDGGAGVVSRAGVHRMVFDRVPDASGDTCYGMGWTTYSWGDGELVMSHDGDVENYVARMCVIPGRDLGIVLLADANDAVGGNARVLADGRRRDLTCGARRGRGRQSGRDARRALLLRRRLLAGDSRLRGARPALAPPGPGGWPWQTPPSGSCVRRGRSPSTWRCPPAWRLSPRASACACATSRASTPSSALVIAHLRRTAGGRRRHEDGLPGTSPGRPGWRCLWRGTCRRARALLVAEGDAAGGLVGTH